MRIESNALSRRVMLAGLGAAPLVGVAPGAGLQNAAGRARLLYGSAVRASALSADAAFRAAVARECSVVTPEIEMKWAWLEPNADQWIFFDTDRIAAFAKATGKTMHGHALLWDQSIPVWARRELADRPDWSIVHRFLTSVIARYAAICPTWDVVNEPMQMSQRMDGLRPSLFLRAFGPDYIRRALNDAREAAPNGKLFLNEYGLDYEIPEQRDKRYLLLKLLEKLKREGAPIDGIGIQAHLRLALQPTFRERVFADFLNDVGSLGLQIRISELDVEEADRTLPVAERDRRVAEAAGAYLDVALDNRAVGSVTCWGLSDRYSWLDEDGRVGNRGLPLDRDLDAKPFHAAIQRAFRQRLGKSTVNHG